MQHAWAVPATCAVYMALGIASKLVAGARGEGGGLHTCSFSEAPPPEWWPEQPAATCPIHSTSRDFNSMWRQFPAAAGNALLPAVTVTAASVLVALLVEPFRVGANVLARQVAATARAKQHILMWSVTAMALTFLTFENGQMRLAEPNWGFAPCMLAVDRPRSACAVCLLLPAVSHGVVAALSWASAAAQVGAHALAQMVRPVFGGVGGVVEAVALLFTLYAGGGTTSAFQPSEHRLQPHLLRVLFVLSIALAAGLLQQLGPRDHLDTDHLAGLPDQSPLAWRPWHASQSRAGRMGMRRVYANHVATRMWAHLQWAARFVVGDMHGCDTCLMLLAALRLATCASNNAAPPHDASPVAATVSAPMVHWLEAEDVTMDADDNCAEEEVVPNSGAEEDLQCEVGAQPVRVADPADGQPEYTPAPGPSDGGMRAAAATEDQVRQATMREVEMLYGDMDDALGDDDPPATRDDIEHILRDPTFATKVKTSFLTIANLAHKDGSGNPMQKLFEHATTEDVDGGKWWQSAGSTIASGRRKLGSAWHRFVHA
eukprot:jgi/Ulvmu1/6025/UM267_0001.1